jgi:hypothetical protein
MAQTITILLAIVALLASARTVEPRNALQPDSLPQPVAVLDNVDLMDLMVKPAYDELQQAVTKPPADRKGWAAMYQKAARLAEIENLLFFRTRAEASRRPEWAANAARARQAAADVAAAALLGLRSARPDDFEPVRERFPAISAGCTACHRAFAREAPVIKP